MTRYMNKEEYERLNTTIIDLETGLTLMDLIEYLDPYLDIIIVD